MVAQELFREKVYAGRPYAHAALGNSSALQSLTRDDVARFQAARVRPSRTVLAVAGDVAGGDVARMARELFGDWRQETGPADGGKKPASGGIDPQAGAAPRTGEFVRTVPASQSIVILGGSGAPVASPDFETLRLIGTHLTLQAFDDMVFKRRAAFGATAIPEGLRDAGSLAIEVVAPHGRREEALFDLQRLMRNLTIAETSGEEIETASRVQSGREAQALQGVAALAATLAYREAAGLGAASYRDELAPPRPSPGREVVATSSWIN